VFNTGEAVEGIEFDLKRKDGQIRSIVTSVTLIYSDEKKPVGYRGIARDVTERTKLENDIAVYRRKTQNAKEVTIMGLAKLSEYRDNDAGSHLERIREFSKIIAQELSGHKKYYGYITPKYVDDIYQSSILHDIGKVGIPDAVLLKPGKLSPEEFDIIKEHSRLGGDALSEIESKIDGESFLTLAKEIAYHHHERWNGKGYPNGLKGDEIPLSARIVALADVYDALTSKRVYKEAFSHEDAIKIIVAERGKQFDPDVVDGFMARNKDFFQIRHVLNQRDAESLGIKISLD
jgi:response regulator RpfG family c-di-GMP phosphodiesterase